MEVRNVKILIFISFIICGYFNKIGTEANNLWITTIIDFILMFIGAIYGFILTKENEDKNINN